MMTSKDSVLLSQKMTIRSSRSWSTRSSAPSPAWTGTPLSPSYKRHPACSQSTRGQHCTHLPRYIKPYNRRSQSTVTLAFNLISLQQMCKPQPGLTINSQYPEEVISTEVAGSITNFQTVSFTQPSKLCSRKVPKNGF